MVLQVVLQFAFSFRLAHDGIKPSFGADMASDDSSDLLFGPRQSLCNLVVAEAGSMEASRGRSAQVVEV